MQAKWIAVDWGTSNLRVWVFAGDGALIDHIVSDRGMGQLAPDQFEATLLALIDHKLAINGITAVVCCGMAGAMQGWREAPYVSVPCAPPAVAEAVRPVVRDPRIAVHIIPGIMQSDPADVMRGEETQIAGLLTENSSFEGVVCLPGTHSKWLEVRAGEIVSFRTYMTGELFALLSKQSILRHSVSTGGWDNGAFGEAVRVAMKSPQDLGARLFTLRAESLLRDIPPNYARAGLSGLLIGWELAGARNFWQNQPVVIVGTERLSLLYQKALAGLDVQVSHREGEAMTLAGLKAAYHGLRDSAG